MTSRLAGLIVAVLVLEGARAFADGPVPLAPAGDALKPPPGAIVLFDGKDLSEWVRRRDGKPAEWKVDNGYVEAVAGAGSLLSRRKFGDCRLHLEFWVPPMPTKFGQDRGNSGVYLQGRYEVQILDSFGVPPDRHSCGALYDLIAPARNACKPVGQWQTYDITFRAPRVTFCAPRVDGQDKVIAAGEITVVQNGVMVIDRGHFDRVTDVKHGTAVDMDLGEPGPIQLQEHGAPVRFRNIWLVPLGPR